MYSMSQYFSSFCTKPVLFVFITHISNGNSEIWQQRTISYPNLLLWRDYQSIHNLSFCSYFNYSLIFLCNLIKFVFSDSISLCRMFNNIYADCQGVKKLSLETLRLLIIIKVNYNIEIQ